MIDVSHSGISASNTDNSALWGIFNQAAQTGEPVLLPPGPLKIASLSPILSGPRLNLKGQNTTLLYTGSAPGIFMQCVNLGKLISDDVTYDGGHVATECIDILRTGTGICPTSWRLSLGACQNIAAGGMAFHVGGTENCDGFEFDQFSFVPNSAAVGFQSDNANSLCHSFMNGSGAANGTYGFRFIGGSFMSYGAQWSGNSAADIYLGPTPGCYIGPGWTQNSYRFLERAWQGYNPGLVTVVTPVFVDGMTISSYPRDWLRNNPGAVYSAEDANDPIGQLAPIVFNANRSLILRGTTLVATAPSEALYAQNKRQYSQDGPLDWINDGSFASDGWGGMTKNFFAMAQAMQ